MSSWESRGSGDGWRNWLLCKTPDDGCLGVLDLQGAENLRYDRLEVQTRKGEDDMSLTVGGSGYKVFALVVSVQDVGWMAGCRSQVTKGKGQLSVGSLEATVQREMKRNRNNNDAMPFRIRQCHGDSYKVNGRGFSRKTCGRHERIDWYFEALSL
jgi:hypothetical protein